MEDLEEIFDYNRENFRFDAKQWQERGFQEQKMRVDQGQLYRDDVRDLMELTTGKMDLYLIMPYGPPGKKKVAIKRMSEASRSFRSSNLASLWICWRATGWLAENSKGVTVTDSAVCRPSPLFA